MLAQPATRPAFLMAKLRGSRSSLRRAPSLGAGVAWVYTSILFEPMPVGGWLAMAVLAWLALLAWAAVTFLASAVTGSTTAAAGLGFVALVVISLLSVVPALGRVLPTGLAAPGTSLATGGTSGDLTADLLTAVAGTLVLIALCAAAAVASFRRREL